MRIEVSDVDGVRRIYDRIARRYDPMMAVVDVLLFSGGRSWVTTRAEGCVLEVAVGTGRNLPLYPPGTCVVGVDVSLAVLALAHSAASLFLSTSTSTSATPSVSPCQTHPSTPSCSRSRSW